MALDEPKDDDEVIQDNGITYLVNKQLLEQIQPIHVDFVDSPLGSGFSITSSLSHGGACGTCSSC
jgi:Fe-S cluster assembly iron-binding protein IscA